MRSRSNGGVIGAFALPSKNYANGVFFIHDAAIYNTGSNPIWPINSGYLANATVTGGGSITIDSNDTNYKYATFTSNGTFSIITGSGMVEMLLVGGGGGGGAGYTQSNGFVTPGAGGGGGGVVVQNLWMNPGTLVDIKIGAGGAGGTYSAYASLNGVTTSAISGSGFSFYALGGGSGAGYYTGTGAYSGSSGGSGGGVNQASMTTDTTTTGSTTQSSTYGYGYGNSGGPNAHAVANNPYYSAAGGGGAGSRGVRGAAVTNELNGDGGYGYYSSIPTTQLAGHMYDSSNNAYQHTSSTTSYNGLTVGGGGEGGAASWTSSGSYNYQTGGTGASGIVILRYRYK